MRGRDPTEPCGCTATMLCQDAMKIYSSWQEIYEKTGKRNATLQHHWDTHRRDALNTGEPFDKQSQSRTGYALREHPDWRERLVGRVLPPVEPEPVARRKQ